MHDGSLLTDELRLSADPLPSSAAAPPRRYLLLQGPVGPFFRQLSRQLRRQGQQVRRVALWGGDLIDGPGSLPYRGDLDRWPQWLAQQLRRFAITDLVMFGDERPYHRAARPVAREAGVRVHVFEEGYIRPNFITLEQGGVNANSMLGRAISQVLSSRALPEELPPSREEVVGRWIPAAVHYVIRHYLAGLLLWPCFASYQHHRRRGIFAEALGFTRHWLSRPSRRRDAELRQAELAGLRAMSGRRFFFPLQLENDAQLRVHSTFASVEATMRHTVGSFASHAPPDAQLIVKPHPFDMNWRHHRALLRELAAAHRVSGRVHWVHYLASKDLVLHSQGVVTVNSTTGLQALYHGRPVKALGSALWDCPGLTHAGGLDGFWQAADWPDVTAARRFRHWLWRQSQINGNFYSARGRQLALAAAAQTLSSGPAVRQATEQWVIGHGRRGAAFLSPAVRT